MITIRQSGSVKLQKLSLTAQRAYVKTLMLVLGRALCATSRVDGEARAEVQGLPDDYLIEMVVAPGGAGFKVITQSDGTFKSANNIDRRADLSIRFKHLSHAFMVLSFQEGTAEAFAKDRMIADGELAHSIRLVRILNRMEALILPRWVAKRAVKRYPENLGVAEKVFTAARIYVLVVIQITTGS